MEERACILESVLTPNAALRRRQAYQQLLGWSAIQGWKSKEKPDDWEEAYLCTEPQPSTPASRANVKLRKAL